MDPCRVEDDHSTSGMSCVVGPHGREKQCCCFCSCCSASRCCCCVAVLLPARLPTRRRTTTTLLPPLAAPPRGSPQTTHHAYVLAIPSLVSLLATEVARGSAVLWAVFLLGERGIAVSIIRVDVGVSGRRAAWWQQTLFGVVERSYYNFSSLASRVCYRFSEGFHLSSFLLCFFFRFRFTLLIICCVTWRRRRRRRREREHILVLRGRPLRVVVVVAFFWYGLKARRCWRERVVLLPRGFWFLRSGFFSVFVHSFVPAFKKDTVQGGRYLRCFVSRLVFWSSGWRTPALRFVFGCVWKPVV